MSDLVEIAAESSAGEFADIPASITAYLLGSGQGPTVQIESIPGQFVSFLQDLHSAGVRNRWTALVAKNWASQKLKRALPRSRKRKSDSSTVLTEESIRLKAGQSRNRLYQELLDVFRRGFVDAKAGARFISRHLLAIRRPQPGQLHMSRNDPVPLPRETLRTVDWKLTALFSERVLGMDEKRIERIRAFSDRLAEIIHQYSDKRLLAAVLYPENQFRFRRAIADAQVRYRKNRDVLLFGLDEFVQVFLADDATGVVPWDLVRDLISIRVVEKIHLLQAEKGGGDYPLFRVIEEPTEGDSEESLDGEEESPEVDE
jgi:hypothetical protein